MRVSRIDWDAVWFGVNVEKVQSIRWYQVVGSAGAILVILPIVLTVVPWFLIGEAGGAFLFGMFGTFPVFPIAAALGLAAARRGAIGIIQVVGAGALIGGVAFPVILPLMFGFGPSWEATKLSLPGALCGIIASVPCLLVFWVWRNDLYRLTDDA